MNEMEENVLDLTFFVIKNFLGKGMFQIEWLAGWFTRMWRKKQILITSYLKRKTESFPILTDLIEKEQEKAVQSIGKTIFWNLVSTV